jgi:hypothetical protein
LPSGNQRHPSAILRSGKRFVLRADEKLTAFVELESAILLREIIIPPFEDPRLRHRANSLRR